MGNTAAYRGGGFYAYNCSSTLINNTIYNNSCDNTSSTATGGGILAYSGASVNGNNNIVYGNSATTSPNISGMADFTYCCVEGGLAGTGNVDEDPLFVDPTNDDYHLQSTVGSYHNGQWSPDPSHSPCIDAGDPSAPYGNEPMPNGDCINMGAYGNTAEASSSALASVGSTEEAIPLKLKLLQNYPNPFNPSTTISLMLNEMAQVDLAIYNMSGEMIKILHQGNLGVGLHNFSFEAGDLPTGIYVYRANIGERVLAGKALLVK